ncbi:hypothetical protein KPL74_14115 [Bacillus sp. NP157]|nr:hypothetical protein KPL74_14115 [Bacillus sp. NP157]
MPARRSTIKALLVGLLLAMACGSAGGLGQPSFDSVALRYRPDPFHSDPCGPSRPLAGICRMLRPVRG